jgi:DNA-binding MarR family transcriptional regulator
MEAGGWITRHENPDSRREVLVDLTDSGRALVEDATSRRRQEIREVITKLSAAERTAVLRGLALFASAAGEPAVDELLGLGV